MNEKAQKGLKAIKNYKTARAGILLVTALGLLNVILFLVGADFYFPFSVIFPYCAVIFGDVFATQLGSQAIYIVAIILAVLIVGAYVLLFFLSKERKGCIIAVLVLYAIDLCFVIFLLVESKVYSIAIDLLFHCIAIYELIMGVRSAEQLSEYPQGVKITPEELLAAEGVKGQVIGDGNNGVTVTNENAEPVTAPDVYKPDSAALRDDDGKGRTVISAKNGEVTVVFKRKAKVSELIIDGKVYGERKGLFEPRHYEIEAVYQGITYKAVQNAKMTSFTAEIYAETTLLATSTKVISY